VELWKDFGPNGLVVMALSNESLKKVAPYVERRGLPILVGAGSDTGGLLGKRVGAQGIPHSYLIDAKGELAWHGHPASLTGSQIKKVLKGVRKPGKTALLAWRGAVAGAPSKGLDLAAAGELGKALRLLEGSTEEGSRALAEKLRAHVGDLRSQIEQAVERRDLRLALDTLELLANTLAGHELGQAAAERLEELESDEGVQRELQAAKALDRALATVERRGLEKAEKSLRALIEKYEGTRAAERAAQLLEIGREFP